MGTLYYLCQRKAENINYKMAGRRGFFEEDFGMPMSDYDFELARRRFFQRDPTSLSNRQPTMTMFADRQPMMSMTSFRPSFNRQLSEGRSDVSTADGIFKISLDVKNFDPEDIKVKTVGDVVEIQGRHEDRKDEHGVVKRDFTRKYNIPSNVDPMTITSALSQDGMLTVQAPIRQAALDQGPRVLEVKHEKQPAL